MGNKSMISTVHTTSTIKISFRNTTPRSCLMSMCSPTPTAGNAAPAHLEASAIQSRRDSLAAVLRTHYGVTEQSLIRAIHALGEATAAIQVLLTQYVNHEYAGSQNASGDDQLLLDIACDEAVFAAVRTSGVYATVASEETPHETPVDNSNSDDNSPGMRYSLGCDPLDGSSIIDANFSVGSIYGIWPGTTLVGRTGREQVASAVALYGPRTVLCLALAEQAVVLELTLVRHEWHISRERIHIQPSGKIFAPGNLRATADHAKYRELFQYWMSERYQLRYSGGMVPDVYHILAKSKGIFTNVSSPSAKAKLRLLYEVAPMGLIVELAGGEALFETEDKSVLDITIEHCDHRVGVCFGGTAEVAKYKEIMFS